MRELSSEAERFAVIAAHPRLDDLASLVGAVLLDAAAREQRWTPEQVQALAAERALQGEVADTPMGNPVAALAGADQAGGDARLLLGWLLGRALGAEPHQTAAEHRALALKLAWLSAHTPVDGLWALEVSALGADEAVWLELAQWAVAVDRGDQGAGARSTMLAVVAALPRVPAARGAVPTLRDGLDDARYQAMLRPPVEGLVGEARAVPPESARSERQGQDAARAEGGEGAADAARAERGDSAADAARAKRGDSAAEAEREGPASNELTGELVPGPLGPVALALGAATGLLVLWWLVRGFGRFVLRVRRPANLLVSRRGVTVRSRLEVMGRTVRTREIHVPIEGLARAVREVRYPRLAMYVGLLCLALGSYAGVSLWIDGARAASPSLLGLGALVFGVGVALDLLGSILVPGRGGRTRLILVPRKGRVLALRTGDAAAAGDALRQLAARG